GPPKDGGGPTRARRKEGGAPEEVDSQRRLVAYRAITEHTDEHTLVEALADPQHCLDLAQRDDLRLGGGVHRIEDRVELARILLIHDHRHAQPRLAPSDGTHDLEAAQVRAHEERAGATA